MTTTKGVETRHDSCPRGCEAKVVQSISRLLMNCDKPPRWGGTGLCQAEQSREPSARFSGTFRNIPRGTSGTFSNILLEVRERREQLGILSNISQSVLGERQTAVKTISEDPLLDSEDPLLDSEDPHEDPRVGLILAGEDATAQLSRARPSSSSHTQTHTHITMFPCIFPSPFHND